MRLGVAGNQVCSQGLSCFCRALFESWCVIFDSIFGFKNICLGGVGSKVIFEYVVSLQGGLLSDGSQEQSLPSELCVHLLFLMGRQVLGVCLAHEAGACSGFCACQ